MKKPENERKAATRILHSRWPGMRSAALLAAVIVPINVQAQASAQPSSAPAIESPAKAWRETNTWWYSMKFNGGTITTLKHVWTNTFTNDNFVITESAADVRLPAFEIRHVRLSELARCIAFLGQGALTVEVVDMLAVVSGPGSTKEPLVNIWRIGTPSAAEAPIVKMRAIAVPNLYGRQEVASLLRATEKMEDDRLVSTREFAEVTKSSIPREPRTRVIHLPEQRVVVLIGSENGIAGLESFIQASEQSAVEAAQRFKSAK